MRRETIIKDVVTAFAVPYIPATVSPASTLTVESDTSLPEHITGAEGNFSGEDWKIVMARCAAEYRQACADCDRAV